MGDYMQAALEAVNFIGAQRLEGRTKWRRADDAQGSDYGLYHGSSGIILLLLELRVLRFEPDAADRMVDLVLEARGSEAHPVGRG